MLLPTVLILIIFAYVPMGGLIMAFENYKPITGMLHSKWVGLEHFRFMFTYPDSKQVIINTLVIACMKFVSNLIVPFVIALLLNEVRNRKFKRSVQTLIYMPYFISWVILGAILTDMLSSDGLVNKMLMDWFHMSPVLFMGNGTIYRFTLVFSDTWQTFGYNTIIYLAALAGVNPNLYEAAEVDGATRWKQTLHITIPSIMPTAIVVATLALGGILNAGFDQIFNTYNPLVYAKGDIIDTFVYRMGILGGQFSFGTAMGLFKSFVGMLLIITSYWMAKKFAKYSIF
ncbi:ABC transporter permease [Gorillibacterium massiliense]|uniref:ABC transporter permease n=1 Tax=Gorillibacterium massiliense TaxID=1280390 RepID=UPI000694C956|nr:ABC transporter permease subunit [Gorillibacterium massiliense]